MLEIYLYEILEWLGSNSVSGILITSSATVAALAFAALVFLSNSLTTLANERHKATLVYQQMNQLVEEKFAPPLNQITATSYRPTYATYSLAITEWQYGGVPARRTANDYLLSYADVLKLGLPATISDRQPISPNNRRHLRTICNSVSGTGHISHVFYYVNVRAAVHQADAQVIVVTRSDSGIRTIQNTSNYIPVAIFLFFGAIVLSLFNLLLKDIPGDVFYLGFSSLVVHFVAWGFIIRSVVSAIRVFFAGRRLGRSH